jgi:hypothetical protein
VDRKLGRHMDSSAQAYRAGAAVAHDEQVIWLGTKLEELAGAVKERCAGSREEDIAPMGCEDIGLAVTTGRRNDDFELRHECRSFAETMVMAGQYFTSFCFRRNPRQRIRKMALASALFDSMRRLPGPCIICLLALANSQANAQEGAIPPASQQEAAQHPASGNERPTSAPSRAGDVCRTLEQAAAESGLPVEFLARVIWQESRFNANAVSAKGAQGIAQFMPQTAGWRGLTDPFDPIEALHHSASYLHDLKAQFGNLGLAAAGYNAGPGRVKAWLAGKGALPPETRHYVAIVTGWTADEWASHSPPEASDATIPPGVPCTRLAALVLAPKEEAKRIASYVPRWGIQLAAHLLESKAWVIYRERQKRYASLIGDHEPIVLYKQIPGMGRAKRYIITIADDDRAPLDKICKTLIAAGVTCDVLRSDAGHS